MISRQREGAPNRWIISCIGVAFCLCVGYVLDTHHINLDMLGSAVFGGASGGLVMYLFACCSTIEH